MPIPLRFVVVAVIVFLDQVTKLYVDANLILNQSVIKVFSWFNITLHYNPGAAFSFLSDAGGWQRWFFTIISLVVSVVLCVWLYRLLRHERLMMWSLIFILGGAIGNLIDRVAYGYVIDFIQWHYNNWYFPTFNLADSAITLGAILLLIQTFFGDQPDKQSDKEAA